MNLPPQSFARDLLDGWREFVARTWDWLTVISVSLGNMMNAVWLVLAATWVKQGHGGAGAWTVILIVSGVGALVAGAMALHIPPASLSRVSAYDWFGSLLCEPLALALAGVAAAAIEMSTTLWIAAAVDLAAVAAMLGHRAYGGYGESTNPSSSRVHERSRPAEIGRVRPVFGDTSPSSRQVPGLCRGSSLPGSARSAAEGRDRREHP